MDGNDNGNGSSTAIVRLHAPEKQGQDDQTKKELGESMILIFAQHMNTSRIILTRTHIHKHTIQGTGLLFCFPATFGGIVFETTYTFLILNL